MQHLIEARELARLLAEAAPPVVADCRFALSDPDAGERAWREAHIPGSHYLHLERDLSAPRAATGGRHPLPGAAEFAVVMRRIGLDSDRLLVVLDESRSAFAARLWWLARYFGHPRVRVLDGGLRAWREQGLELGVAPPLARVGNFTAHPEPRRQVDFDFVATAPPGTILVDAREPRRFAGLEEPIDPVAGHIPGACNRPWFEATREDGGFLDAESQTARWRDLPRDAEPVVYCGSGVTACVNLLSLELAGISGGRLYPGSWSDWCSRPGAPVERSKGDT
ncbi:MAG: sulfurtransferase [Pseudomonadales bacterium]|nr:sulfurtransferase [Pseudomonadales bacterium]